jgi:hypothetical protein
MCVDVCVFDVCLCRRVCRKSPVFQLKPLLWPTTIVRLVRLQLPLLLLLLLLTLLTLLLQLLLWL